MVDATPDELRFHQAQMTTLRDELMEHVFQRLIQMGYADRHARMIALFGVCLGAAQRYALSQHGGMGAYEVYKAMCAVFAVSDAKQIMARSGGLELGPEYDAAARDGASAGPGFILPD